MNALNRRDFIKLSNAAVAGSLLGKKASAAPGAGTADIRWNVLFFMSDQHNAHFMTCDNQDPQNVYTPAMQRLADEGVVFDKAYCTYPVCAPTRSSLVTGEFPQKHGQHGNAEYLTESGPDGKTPSIAHVFREAGYNTALLGKTHSNMQGWDAYPDRQYEGRSLFMGFDYRLEGCTGSHHPDSPDIIPSQEVYDAKKQQYQDEHPETEQGEAQPEWEQPIYDAANVNDSLDRFRSWAMNHAAHHKDGVMSFDAEEYLKQYAAGQGAGFQIDSSAPFFMFVSVVQPHWPYSSPKMQDGIDFYAMYSGRPEDDELTYLHRGERRKKLVPLELTEEELAFEMHGWPSPYGESKRDNTAPEAVRLARARYSSAVSWIDHLMGRVLDRLDELDDPNNPGMKLSETTIVCYNTDHGDMMGEKYRMNKMVMQEGSARVPFIMRIPGVLEGGKRSSLLINHVDMFPTLAGLCGLGANLRTEMDGLDLSEAVMSNDASAGPERTFSVASISDDYTRHPAVVMGRSQQYKFIRFRETDGDGNPYLVLFDLDNDPHETTNLADDPRFARVVNQESAAMDEFLAKYGVPEVNLQLDESLAVARPDRGAGHLAAVKQGDRIRFNIKGSKTGEAQRARISIYNMNGKLVRDPGF